MVKRVRNYELIFDEVILGQFNKISKNRDVRKILSKMLDKIEEKGPKAGKLLDPKLRLYELKNKRPPIRLYFRDIGNEEIYVFEYEMKKSNEKQRSTISRLKDRIFGN